MSKEIAIHKAAQSWHYTTRFAVRYVALATIGSGLCGWLLLEGGRASFSSGEGFIIDLIARLIVLFGGLYFFSTGVWTAIALWQNVPIVKANEELIEARSRLGVARRLRWSDISDVVGYDGRIILSEIKISKRQQWGGINWKRVKYRLFAIEVWNPRAVIINPAILDAAADQICDLVLRRRPDLVMRKL